MPTAPALERTAHVAAVVYNPTKVDVKALRRIVATEEKAAGWAPSLWFESSADDSGDAAAADALAAGASMVLAAGGDGTVRAVAQRLDSSGMPLALLPVGTANLLARNLKLTVGNMEHSVRAAFTGKDRPVDLARIQIRRADDSVESHAFLVMAGVGLDAKMFAATNTELKRRIGYGAYVVAFGKALRDKGRLRLRYQVDGGQSRSVKANTIIVGNCGSLKGNIMLLPDAVVDDGLLDALLLKPESVFGWVQVAVKVFWENGVLRRSRTGRLFLTDDVSALRYFNGTQIVVRFDQDEEIQLDGDRFGRANAFKVEVAPGALLLRVPNE